MLGKLRIDHLVRFFAVESTHVQALDLAWVLAFFWIYFKIFRRYALSGK
jgi:hypothetical protein